MKRVFGIVVFVLVAASLYAHLSLVEFTAELVAKNTDGEVTVFSVRVADTTLLEIRANGLTEIRDGLEEKTVDDLMPGMILKIEAFHTDDGFTARRIEVTDAAADIEVRGRVTALTQDPDGLTVAGLTILVDERTQIRDFSSPPRPLAFEDLEVDDFVKVEARPDGDDLIARTIRVGDPGERFARLAFEGTITTLDLEAQMMTVAVESVANPLPVVWTEDTRFNGTPAVGADVVVIGHLNADLTTVADRVIVQRLLHLAPGTVKMRTNDSRKVQIILRDVMTEDLELTIGVAPESSSLEISPSDLVIPAGQVSGFFTLSSGEVEEDAEVTVAAGPLTATAQVEVRGRGQGQGPTAIAWSPPQLVLKAGRSRAVLLRLNEAPETDLAVGLSLITETPELVAGFEAELVFAAGQRRMQITVTAGESAGEAVLRAELPGGESADLEIRVRD